MADWSGNPEDKEKEDAAYEEQWITAVAASNTPEAIEEMWLPRTETTKVWGSKFFDHDLNPLDRASDGAALAVRLIRESHSDTGAVQFEIRTSLALSPQLWDIIANAQRELAERRGLLFPEPGTARPHVLTKGKRGLVRAYGKGSIFEVYDAALPRLRAYGFLARIWRKALASNTPLAIDWVGCIARDRLIEDGFDPGYLFATADERQNLTELRPELTDHLVSRVGMAIGCHVRPDGRFEGPVEPIPYDELFPPVIVRLVAEELAAERGVDVDTMLRKKLQPMIAGEFEGPIVHYTPSEADAVRAALKQRQVDPTGDPEN